MTHLTIGSNVRWEDPSSHARSFYIQDILSDSQLIEDADTLVTLGAYDDEDWETTLPARELM